MWQSATETESLGCTHELDYELEVVASACGNNSEQLPHIRSSSETLPLYRFYRAAWPKENLNLHSTLLRSAPPQPPPPPPLPPPSPPPTLAVIAREGCLGLELICLLLAHIIAHLLEVIVLGCAGVSTPEIRSCIRWRKVVYSVAWVNVSAASVLTVHSSASGSP